MSKSRYMSVDGKIVADEKATVPFLSPAAKYGASVFEGIRGYWSDEHDDLFVFRLEEHLRRLRQSMKLMRFDRAFEETYLKQVVLDTIRANELKQDIHVRLSALLLGEGLYDSSGPVSLMCAALPSPSKGLEQKVVRAGVSSFRRISEQSIPPRIKCGSNYQNSRLGSMEVQAAGYEKVIFLTQGGTVSEGAGESIFIVRDGKIVTPAITEGILESITRETVIEIAGEYSGAQVAERPIDRTELYISDEVFFAGSMAEIRPIVEVDRIVIGHGGVGTRTANIWESLESICRSRVADHESWRTSVFGT